MRLKVLNCNINDYIRNISIKNKIVFLNVMGLVLLSSLIILFANIISQSVILDKGKKDSYRELTLINKNVEILINDIESYIRIFSTDSRIQQDMEISKKIPWGSIEQYDINVNLRDVIDSIQTPYTYLTGGGIVGVNGSYVEGAYYDMTSIRRIFINLLDYSKTPSKKLRADLTPKLIEFIKSKQNPIIYDIYNFKIKSNFNKNFKTFVFTKAIKSIVSGEMLGIIYVTLNEDYISSIYQKNKVGVNNEFYILNDEDIVMSSENKSDINKNFYKVMTKNFPGLSEGSVITKIKGKKYMATLKNFENLTWKTVSLVPIEDITVVSKRIAQLIFVVTIFCIVLVMFISMRLSRRVSKPILSLANTMKGINRNNMNIKVHYDSKDEIGILGEGFNKMMEDINDLMHEINEEQMFKREYEFKLIQSQINPHFLYNTIETIISFIKIGMYDNAIITAKYLANFYRGFLSKGNDLIEIRNEVELTSSYLAIQKLRYSEYMDYSIEFDENILDFTIPKLTLQPIIENAIYHGLKEKEECEKGVLEIRGCLEGTNIKIEIFDNGIGMSNEKIQEVLNQSREKGIKKAFGVGSVNLRLKFLYGKDFGIDIISEIGLYTKVSIKIPCKK